MLHLMCLSCLDDTSSGTWINPRDLDLCSGNRGRRALDLFPDADVAGADHDVAPGLLRQQRLGLPRSGDHPAGEDGDVREGTKAANGVEKQAGPLVGRIWNGLTFPG
jgi:hypothetical protein